MTHEPEDYGRITQAEADRGEEAGHPDPAELDEARKLPWVKRAQPQAEAAEWPDNALDDFTVPPRGARLR